MGLRDTLNDWFADRAAGLRRRIKRVRMHLFAFGLFALGLVEAIDPYALQSLLPGRWGALGFIGIGVVAWLLRKASEHPPIVTTTAYGEAATTEPHDDAH